VAICGADGGEQGDGLLGRSARGNGLSGALGHYKRELSEQFGGAAGDGSAIHGVGFGA
jgi:hypothetical protein